MQIQIFSKEKDWVSAAIDFIKSKNPKTVALCGGTTPEKIYKALSKIVIADKIKFYQVDERYVPKNHPDSNQKMIRATLKPKIFHYFDTALPITQALKNYATKLPKQFDLVILGIGEDGHIASLFPNSTALKSTKIVMHTTTNKFVIKDRLTITLPLILKSKTILVLLKNKSKILQELQNSKKSPRKFPALKSLNYRNLHIFSLQ